MGLNRYTSAKHDALLREAHTAIAEGQIVVGLCPKKIVDLVMEIQDERDDKEAALRNLRDAKAALAATLDYLAEQPETTELLSLRALVEVELAEVEQTENED